MKIDSIDASRMGYSSEISLPFSIDIPDDIYWRYDDTDKNYIILVEAVLKFKEICEKQQESIEKKRRVINYFYGYGNNGIYEEAIDAFRNYVTSDSFRAQAFNNFVTAWEDEPSEPSSIPETISKYERSYNGKTNSEKNNKEQNETTAFTSGEISW